MGTIIVCETCGSENVHTAGDGGMGFCEDCDAPCTTIEVEEESRYTTCENCGEAIEVNDSGRCPLCDWDLD